MNLRTNQSDVSLGATISPKGVQFGIWAPAAERIDVVIENGEAVSRHPMDRDEHGIHTALVPDAGPGTLYQFSVNGAPGMPDPRSRFQPLGVHGPSEVIDLESFAWSATDWLGLSNQNLSFYELHIGTYTPDGTFEALTGQLEEIARLGVRVIELMPVADFPGRWNWGYDGVALFAPSRAYGRPEDLQRLVDTAHQVGLGVLLDVVYNHLGPDGNYLTYYSADYLTDRHQTPWGDAVNFDAQNARFVRDFVIENAIQWVRDYRFDGLRVDAVDAIKDDSNPHILAELQERVRASVDREIMLVAEDARNRVGTITPVAGGGDGFDAFWADDFHHEMRVLLSNAWELYYADYTGSVEAVASALNDGIIYQGQESGFLGRPRGTRITDESANAFVFELQNHDQIGNRPFGERLHHEIDRERFHVASTVLLLAPETPLIFMGQEFAASTPFLFFTDHHDELGPLVTEGRQNEFSGFRAFAEGGAKRSIPDPQDEATFHASKLRLAERAWHKDTYHLYQRLFALRHDDPVFQTQDRSLSRAFPIDALVLGLHRQRETQHRLLIANFGHEIKVPLSRFQLGFDTAPEDWRLMLATSAAEFGGMESSVAFEHDGYAFELIVPARTAIVFDINMPLNRSEPK